jgi:hypothetical protein
VHDRIAHLVTELQILGGDERHRGQCRASFQVPVNVCDHNYRITLSATYFMAVE